MFVQAYSNLGLILTNIERFNDAEEWLRKGISIDSNFIDNYKVYLAKKDKETAVAYYQSLVYYLQGDWDETLTILNKNDYKSIYQPRSRIIMVRALFEQFLENSDFHELLFANDASAGLRSLLLYLCNVDVVPNPSPLLLPHLLLPLPPTER